MGEARKLSFVLLAALREPGSSSPGEATVSWRNASDEMQLLRLHTLLSSFVLMFDQDDLEEFILICPPRDIGPFTSFIGTITDDPRYKVLSEVEACPEISDMVDENTNEVKGWFAQQLLKLAIYERIASEYYVTLDSDIICIKPFSYNSLIRGGRALLNVETPSDYERIYTTSFAKQEEDIKTRRYERSAELLGYKRPDVFRHKFYGETPVVLHRKSVASLAAHLSNRFAIPWRSALARNLPWSEYGLYFQHLEMKEKLHLVYEAGDCNSVLHLEKSVWHASDRYRHLRIYDAAHFHAGKSQNNGGYFVAVQSWLSVESWLPDRFDNITEFYQEVEQWLFGKDRPA
jgi:hypothetical protein